MNENFARISCLALLLLGYSACVNTPAPEDNPPRPPVGIVFSVNLAERMLVFESEYRIPPGMQMRLLRDGSTVGMLRAGSVRRRRFQSADILEGRPQPGDLVEPLLPVKPQATE